MDAAAEIADDYVRENPWTAVGIAGGIGLDRPAGEEDRVLANLADYRKGWEAGRKNCTDRHAAAEDLVAHTQRQVAAHRSRCPASAASHSRIDAGRWSG